MKVPRSNHGPPAAVAAAVAVALLFGGASCRCIEEGGDSLRQSAAEPGRDEILAPSGAERAEEPSPSKAEEASVAEELEEAEDDPLDPTRFVGFSADEASFAYSVFSRGAGVFLFTVIDSATGRRVTDLPLYDEESKAVARLLLEEGGFSPLSPGEPRGEETLRLEAEPGEVRVFLGQGGSEVRVEPPRALESVARRLRSPAIELAGFSSGGEYLVVRVMDDHGPVLGEATTYQVLDLRQARAEL